MRVLAMLTAALLFAAGATDDSIVLSVAALPSAVTLSESVSFVITLRNLSKEPRYVHRNVKRHLDFAVWDGDGRQLRRFVHPFMMPLDVSDPRDLVLIDAGQSLRCAADIPLADLGIKSAGVFSVRGFWAADSVPRPQVSAPTAIHFEHAADTYLTVVAGKVDAPRVRPGGPLPKCVSAEAETP